MENIIEQAKLLWQCRRGMLELDLFLVPFAKKHYASQSEEQQKNFRNLLTYPDPDLFAWLMGHESPEDPELIEIVQLVKRLHKPTPL
jgi:antitoxin CptB